MKLKLLSFVIFSKVYKKVFSGTNVPASTEEKVVILR